MEHKKQRSFPAAVMMLAVTLGGCSTPRLPPDAQGVSFPLREASYRSEGIVVPLETVRLLQPGLSKDQVRQLIGNPHFSEGLLGVRDWNYILRVPGSDGGLVDCQFQLGFDEQGRVSSTHWQTGPCAAAAGQPMLTTAVPATTATAAPAKATATATATTAATAAPASTPSTTATTATPAAQAGGKSAETAEGWTESGLIFPFGRSALGDMRATDRARLKALVARTARQAGSVERIVVVGHADRVGSVQRKQWRSLDRAHAVAEAFAAKGIAPGVIEVVGRSDAEPIATCLSQQPLSELLACLAPDRRVSVTVHMKAG
jgi:outer membrane protein OmpA-like peptidoglycan-associated protein